MRRGTYYDRGERRVLLIAGVPPCTNYSGGIFLDAILRAAPIRLAAIVAVQNDALEPDIPSDIVADIPITTLTKPREWYDHETWGDDAKSIRAAEQVAVRDHIPRIVEAVNKTIDDHRISDVWIILEGQTLIRLALRLSVRKDVRIKPHVTDPPRWWLRTCGVDRETQLETLDDFEHVLRGASSVACASQPMADRYAALYGTTTIPLVHSLPDALRRPPAIPNDVAGPIQIGFAGQDYASDELKALISAAGSLNQSGTFGRIEVQLTLINSTVAHAWKHDHVVFRSATDQRTLVERLSRMHLLYCPYWFDPRFREESDLCFPSKLTAYLASGRPVLFHGRRDASPARFLIANEAAFFSFSPDPLALESAIARALADENGRTRIAAAGSRAFSESLEYRCLAQAVSRFIEKDKQDERHSS